MFELAAPGFLSMEIRVKLRFSLLTGLVAVVFSATSGRAQPAPWTPGDTVRVAVLEYWPPHYQVREDGTPAGFAVDVMEAVAARADLTVRFIQFGSFPEVLAALENGDVDVIPDLGIISSRTDAYAFTRPFDAFRLSVFVRESSPYLQNADALDGRRVGVVRSNAAVDLLRERHPDAELVVFDNVREALFELMAAGVDAAAYPEEVFLALARSADLRDRLRILPDPLTEVSRGMGVRSTDDALRNRLDRGVEELVGSATYEEIYQRWFGAAESFWTVERVVWGGGALLFLILLGMGLWRYRSVSKLAERLRKSLDERRAAEAARREEEIRFQTLVEAAYEGVVLANEENRIVFVNRRSCEIVGRDEEEMLGESIFRFVAEEHQERIRAGVQRRREGGSDSYELLLRRSDGGRVWVLMSVAPIQGASGEFRGSVATMTEITERKEAERALEESARHLRRTLASLEAAVLVVDPGERRIVECNEAAEEMFGYSRQELLGRETRSLHVDEEHFREFGRRSEDVLEDGRSFSTDFVMRRADGTTFPSRHTVTLLDADEGLAGGVVSVVRDVSEQRRAEAELRESEERFRQIAEHIDDIFWVRTPDSGEVLYLSPAYETITGRSRAEVYDDPSAWLETVHPDDRERVLAQRPAGGDVEFEEEYRIIDADGEIRWIWDRAFPIQNEQGEVYRIVGVAEDVTRRKELEDQLRESQKMEAVGRLAGGIAHDFNNLLTVIRSQADLLEIDGDLSDDTEADIEVIRGAADRAAKLTGQLLAFSRKQVLQPRVVDLNAVVRNMDQLLRRVLGDDVRVETNLREPLPPIRVDPSQMEHVILNLAVNAREAMPDGGPLTLSTSVESVEGMDHGSEEAAREDGTEDRVRLDVADEGVGMDAETQAQVFDPFFTTKAESGGTGLGLATVYGVVEQSGGSIRVETEPGEGATFTIRFPVADGDAEAPSEETAPPRQQVEGLSGRILVVEDDASVRSVTRRILERGGLEVRVAGDAETGLEILAEEGEFVDLVLTDLVLPGMGGRDLLERLRERRPDLSVVVMSGYAEGSSDSRRDLPPEIGFLQKPFSSEALLQFVAERLGERREPE